MDSGRTRTAWEDDGSIGACFKQMCSRLFDDGDGGGGSKELIAAGGCIECRKNEDLVHYHLVLLVKRFRPRVQYHSFVVVVERWELSEQHPLDFRFGLRR